MRLSCSRVRAFVTGSIFLRGDSAMARVARHMTPEELNQLRLWQSRPGHLSTRELWKKHVKNRKGLRLKPLCLRAFRNVWVRQGSSWARQSTASRHACLLSMKQTADTVPLIDVCILGVWHGLCRLETCCHFYAACAHSLVAAVRRCDAMLDYRVQALTQLSVKTRSKNTL